MNLTAYHQRLTILFGIHHWYGSYTKREARKIDLELNFCSPGEGDPLYKCHRCCVLYSNSVRFSAAAFLLHVIMVSIGAHHLLLHCWHAGNSPVVLKLD